MVESLAGGGLARSTSGMTDASAAGGEDTPRPTPLTVKEAVRRAFETFKEIQIAKVTDLVLEGVDVPESPNDTWTITVGFRVATPEYSLPGLLLGKDQRSQRLRTVIRIGGDGSFRGMKPERSFGPE